MKWSGWEGKVSLLPAERREVLQLLLYFVFLLFVSASECRLLEQGNSPDCLVFINIFTS